MAAWEAWRETALFPFFLAALGAAAGSFASAAAYRIPRPSLSLVRPLRSFCPSCRRPIPWYDNIPVLGWILLRGRCRQCGEAFGWSYLLHELVLAALFVAAGYSWAGAEPLALALVAVALTGLWIAAVVDWNELFLPDGITVGGVPFGLAASVLVPSFQLWDPLRPGAPWGAGWLGLDPARDTVLMAAASSVAGAAGSFAFLFGLRALFTYLLREEALGFGDVKYLAAVGALVGLEGSAWTLLVGVMAGAALGVLNIARVTAVLAARHRARAVPRRWRRTLYKGWRLGRLIPFGPALVLGTTLVLLAPLWTRHFFLQAWPAFLASILT